jgi:hypothetical protein
VHSIHTTRRGFCRKAFRKTEPVVAEAMESPLAQYRLLFYQTLLSCCKPIPTGRFGPAAAV